MPQTLESVALPQPHSSCWQPLGCLSPLCWTGIAGRHTTGRAVTDRRCCRRGTNWGKQEQQSTAPWAAQGREGTWKSDLDCCWWGKGKAGGLNKREKTHLCECVTLLSSSTRLCYRQPFATKGNDVTILFWIKKWELLWCLQAWETYLHALPSGTLPPFPSWALSHFSYHGSVLSRKPSDGPLLSLSHHGLHCAFLWGRHYPDPSGSYSSC